MIFGFSCLLVFGGTIDGVFIIIQDQLRISYTDGEIKEAIQLGMSVSDVKEFLGNPDSGESGSGRFLYNQLKSSGGDVSTLVIILFKDGKVSDVVLKTPTPYYSK